MDTLGERFEAVLKAKGEKKTVAAQKLNVSPALITKICNGETKSSDRTIGDICRVYGVNEVWLRTGVGEMFEERSQTAEVMDFLGKLVNIPDDDIRIRFLTAMSKLDDRGWAVIEQIARDMVAENKTDTEEASD